MAIAEIADELAAAYSSEEVEQYLDDREVFETNLHARQLEEDALKAAAREFSESRQLFVGQAPMGLEQQFSSTATASQQSLSQKQKPRAKKSRKSTGGAMSAPSQSQEDRIEAAKQAFFYKGS